MENRYIFLEAGGARFGAPLSSENIRKQGRWIGGGLHEVTALSTGFWCTECVITRRGGVIQEINRSSVRELERYCRVEARGNLGYAGARQTCCEKQKTPAGCPPCSPGQRPTRNESTLSFHMRQFLPVWAASAEPSAPGAPPWTREDERQWRCKHPLCTGAEPDKFP